MTTENETTVTEQPATHNKKAQLWVFVLLGAVLFFLIVDVTVKLMRGPTQLSKRRDAEPALANVAAPQASEAEFQRQLEREDERRARAAAEDAKKTETPGQALDRLRAERERAAGIAALPPAERADAKQQLAAARAGGAQGRVQKTPAEQWAEKEELRVLNSRAASLKVQLADARTAAAASASRNPAATRSPAAQQRIAGTGNALSHEQASVKAELERMETLKRRLESGNADPEDVAAEMGAGFQRTGFTDTAESAQPSAQRARAPQRGAGQVVGRPAAAAEPDPDQKHISVGTVARAVIDQKVMSDYEGPFRCMFIDDVYDVTNRYIIIPKGSRCTGQTARVRNINEPIQARMAMLVNWIILPDGSKISLDKKAALDAEGVAAIKDQVNRHFMAQFLGVAAYAVVSSETSREGSGLGVDRTFESDIGEGLRDQFAPLARKYLDLVPTITLRPGTPMRIFFEDDIYAHPWSSVSSDIVSQARTTDAR